MVKQSYKLLIIQALMAVILIIVALVAWAI